MEDLTKDKLIELSIDWFNNIRESSKRLTTGNVSHNSRQIEGFALRCKEFLELYKDTAKG